MNQVNRKRWSVPLGGVESCWERCLLRTAGVPNSCHYCNAAKIYKKNKQVCVDPPRYTALTLPARCSARAPAADIGRYIDGHLTVTSTLRR